MGKILTMEQGSLEWDMARLGKVTGSRVDKCLAKKTTQGYQTIKAEIIAERLTNQAKSLAWGKENEAMARREHALISSWEIVEVGFVELNENMGCSPDGLINDDGMVQYKCPKNSDVHIKTLLSQAVPKEYFPQLQWELFTTGRQWTEFVSFDPRMPEELRLCVLHVKADYDYQKAMLMAVEGFLGDMENDLAKLQEMIDEIRQYGLPGPIPAVGVVE